MKLTFIQVDDYFEARIEGCIDDSAKEPFDEFLHPLISRPGQRLLLDLADADRITSIGIGHLVTLVSRANAKGSHVVMARPSSFVMSVFQATKLTTFFAVEPSLEAAISRLLRA